MRPDLVIPLGDRATRLVADRMPGVTIVFGLCTRAPRTAPNRSRITGVLLDVPADRQLAVFRAAVPSLARVGVIYDPARSADLVARIATAAQAAGIDLYTQRVSSAGEVPAAFRTIAAAVDGILMIPDETVVSRASFDYMLLKSFERRVPLMVFSEPMVRAGGLLALAADSRPIGRQVGELAAAVLRSGRTRLPSIEVPRLLSLTINAGSAGLLGLTLSRDLLDNAARVYGEGRK
jgi:putative ABC transport system substrate-binding protein